MKEGEGCRLLFLVKRKIEENIDDYSGNEGKVYNLR